MTPFRGVAQSMHTAIGEIAPLHVVNAPNNGSTTDWRYYAGDSSDSGQISVIGGHSWMMLNELGLPTGNAESQATQAIDCNLTEW